MPLGEFIAETVAQGVMEVGGEAIKRRYGWRGCLAAIVMTIAVAALAIWYLTG